jgi:hypothetical protein
MRIYPNPPNNPDEVKIMQLTFYCSEDNDLYQVLSGTGHIFPRYDSFAAALKATPENTALLALADTYPHPELKIDADHLRLIDEKGLRLYLEYPASVPGFDLDRPRPTQWERAVVSSDFFAPDLEEARILALHGCWYLPFKADNPHLVVARVAGYHTAVYGLPEEHYPILAEHSTHSILVAASKLSQFVTGRYGPTPAWKAIWERLLTWLCPETEIPSLSWTPTVGVQFDPEDELSDGAETDAFGRAVTWFNDHIVYSIDWKKGAIEGFEAGIDYNGRQLPRTWPRGDCIGESSMVFAWDWQLTGNPASHLRAGQLLDYVFSSPDFFHDDPQDPAYGLNNWFERGPVFYGDDNARVLLPALTAARLLDDDRWDERILKCLLANLRTTGPLGFRRPRINGEQIPKNGGWPFFYAEEHIHYAPHYQAYLWACFLWAYALTGDREFLDKPKNALRMSVEAFPDQWRWTNGLAQEIARILLPLSFLVRVDDTPEHRAWLRRFADELLTQMQPCGAIREKLGDLGQGSYGPPATNEAYGTSEATLIQANGDPACDLLYTANYAFIGLHEAAAATGDAELQVAADRMAEFFCRIQVRSQAQPYLDGAWMRSFDYELWEYWGSSADLGWGAWSVESGWTNTWLASVLAMRQSGQSLFNTGLAERFQKIYPALREEMFTPPSGEGDLSGDTGGLQAPGSE